MYILKSYTVNMGKMRTLECVQAQKFVVMVGEADYENVRAKIIVNT